MGQMLDSVTRARLVCPYCGSEDLLGPYGEYGYCVCNSCKRGCDRPVKKRDKHGRLVKEFSTE